MAHFALLWKARAVEKYRSNYEEEKIKSISLAEVELPRKRLSEKWRSYRLATNATVSRTFSRWFPNGSTVYRCLLYLRSDETFATFLLKSVLGFTGGIVLTYLCFIFFVFQLSISLMLATIISSIIGVLLTLGLAFSYRIRCLVFLLIPQLFSRVGRYTLTCYALVLILTGPATNTLKNSEVLSESMACSQEQIKTSVRQINKSHKIRYSSIKDNLKVMMERFEEISKQLTNAIVKINRLVLSIVSSVQASFNWLKSIATNCNQKIGTPYNYCKRHLNEGVKDCKDVLGPDYSWLCDVNNVAEATCGDIMKYKSFCGVSEFIDDSIPVTIKKKLKTFSNRIASLLYMELHIHYSYSFSSNASRSASQVAAGIVTEIRNRADPLLTWLSWSSCVTSLFLLLIIFRAKYYQQMYDTRSRFDNRYITQELRDLDLKRLREGRETILPLNRRERAKYVTTTSFRLVPSEKVHLNRSAVFMTITTFKLLIHIVADYSLYWVLMTIEYYGRSQSSVDDELPNIAFNISGTSFAARLLKSLINTLMIPLSSLSDASPTSCLPDPYPPDLRRYMQIGALIFLLWFFALFEPYGLRLRHVIMGRYRPERAKVRATWLYNHILRTRGGFMKLARRKLHREYKYSTEAHLTLKEWITAHIPFKIFRFLFGICAEDKVCFLCGTKEYPNDIDTELIRCKSKTCQGIYCCRCFSDIGQLCTICLSPKDYGDLSDVSLEKGSSEDSSDSDNDNNENPPSGSKFSNGNINYQKNDKYYFKEERKEKKDWNVFTKNYRREDEIRLLPYTSYRISCIAILYDYKAKFDNDISYINATLFKLKVTLRNNSQKLVQYKKKLYTNMQKIPNFLKFSIYNYEILLKDLAITTICNFKVIMESIIQYSFYEIEKFNNSLFITRVRQSTITANVIRRQCKSVVRRKQQCNSKIGHNNMAGHHLTKRQDICKARSNENIFDTRNKRKKQRTKKNKDKNKKQNHTHKQDKITMSCFGKFMLWIKCWKQIKFDLLSCPDPVNESRTKMQSSKEIKNYKRRKKRNKTDLRNSNSLEQCKMDIDDTRKFRMFAYFSDQEWMRKKSETKSYNIKFEFDNEVNYNALEVISSETATSKVKEETSKIDIKSKARSLNSIQTKYKPSTQTRRTLRPKNYPPSEYQKYIDRINFGSKELTRKTVVRFRDTIGLKSQSASKKVIDNLTFVQNDQTREDFIAPSPQPSTSFSRRINFYRSLGANEFDDMYDILNANERIDLKLKRKSSSKSGKENGLSIAMRKKLNTMRDKGCKSPQDKGCGTDPVVKSPPKRHKGSMTNEGLKKKRLQIKFKNPFCMIKEFFSTATEGYSNVMWGKRNIRHVKIGTQISPVKTVSKEVYVVPVTKSCSCQCITQGDAKEMTTQTSKETFEEKSLGPAVASRSSMEIDMCHKNCILTTKRTIVQRDMGTRVNHLQPEQREYNENVQINSTDSSDASFAIGDVPSVFSLRNNGTNKTGTTILSLPTIYCKEDRRVRGKKFKIPVVTKANQSTATEKANFCDVSTVTEDWWSPILERKKLKNSPTIQSKQKEILLEKKGGFVVQNEKARKRLKNRGVMTDGKIVTFRSRTQMIPAGALQTEEEAEVQEIADILSPSRYLLESQKYYNELFLSKYYGNRAVPVLQLQKQMLADKEKSPNFNRSQTRRRHKHKRLEEKYSSRKQFSPRKRTINSKTYETPRARREAFKYDKKRNRYKLLEAGKKFKK